MSEAARTETAELEPRLEAALLAAGLVDEAGLARARAAGQPLIRALTRLGLVAEDALRDLLARLTGLPLAQTWPSRSVLADRLSAAFLARALVVPLAHDGQGLDLAMADPGDAYSLRAVALAAGCRPRPHLATESDIRAALARLAAAAAAPAAHSGDDALLDAADSAAPAVRAVAAMIDQALAAGASDIHLEPLAGAPRLRLRIDGVLSPADPPPAPLLPAVVSRLKLMAGLDIAETRLPQDGRFRTVARGRALDIRVATMPTIHGESLVLRLLDRAGSALTLDRLGLDGPVRDGLLALLARPHGIILVTGPTGAGKTTTLHAALRHLDSDGRKLISIEDPVEYRLDGISQIQVRPAIGLDFARVLRTALRQDPDVLLVGEIRDRETAEIAVQAALTGHLVLTTLHTNSAAQAVTRLAEMGVPGWLLAPTLSGVLAQRLVRRLCPDCAGPAPDAPAPPGIDRAGLRAAPGCPACRGTGARGRLAVAELLTMTPDLSRLVLEGADAASLDAAARAAGMVPLARDAAARAAAGEIAPTEALLLGAGA